MVAINPRRVSAAAMFSKDRTARDDILKANTREEAEPVARVKNFVLLEVVAPWSFPARDWGNANRKLWQASK